MFFKKSEHMKALAELLAYGDNREGFLGIKATALPTPDQVRTQAAKMARYSESKDYQVFAEEVWARVLSHLDVILDDKSSDEKVKYHRGALREALDLLRVSYAARNVLEESAKQDEASAR